MSSRSNRRPWAEDRGGAALEVIGLLPFFLLVAVAAVQLGLVGWTSIETAHAARDAARAATLDEDPTSAAENSLTGGLHVQSMSVVGGDSRRVRLTVRIPSLIGFQVGTVTRTAEMPRLRP